MRPSEGCAAAEVTAGRKIERQIAVDGTTREFVLDVPDGIAPGAPAPLVFVFHGFGHSGAGLWAVSDMRSLAERHHFIAVFPTGLPVTLELRGREQSAPGWQMRAGAENRDIAFTRAMLAEIERSYCIDRDRVFATGFSNGAFFSSLLGCAMSEQFAAVAPVAGGGLPEACRPARPVPVMIHHGTRDDLITVDRARAGRDQWLAANRCASTPAAGDGDAAACARFADCAGGAVVIYCEEEYAHRWPPQASQRIWHFFNTRRATPAP